MATTMVDTSLQPEAGWTAPVHPALRIVPELTPAEQAALDADVAENGLVTPIAILDGRVIDGRARLRACRAAGINPKFEEVSIESVTAYVLTSNVSRRHLSVAQRAAIGAAAEKHFMAEAKERQRRAGGAHPAKLTGTARKKHEGEWAAAAARAVSVSASSIRKMAFVRRSAPEVARAVRDGLIRNVSDAVRIAERPSPQQEKILRFVRKHPQANPRFEITKVAREAKLAAIRDPSHLRGVSVLTGDLLEAGNEVADGSVDAIITDPPYGHQYLPLYERLGQLAGRVLRPGGVCLVMTGSGYLPEVITTLQATLTYVWTIAFTTPTRSHVRHPDVRTLWKPVLVFSRGPYSGKPIIGDIVTSTSKEKELHEWQQDETAFSGLVKLVAEPGDLILDPFVGSGTTGAAALRLGCRFTGIDIVTSTVKVARARLAQVVSEIDVARDETKGRRSA